MRVADTSSPPGKFIEFLFVGMMNEFLGHVIGGAGLASNPRAGLRVPSKGVPKFRGGRSDGISRSGSRASGEAPRGRPVAPARAPCPYESLSIAHRTVWPIR